MEWSNGCRKNEWWGEPADMTYDMYLWSWWGARGNQISYSSSSF